MRIFLFIALLGTFIKTTAQNITIKGKLLDETKQAAIGASVLLLNPGDSVMIKGTVTDIDGLYSISTEGQKKYILKIMSLGYKDQFRTLNAGNDSINMGTISLAQNSTVLKEVLVEGKAPLATQNGDTTSFNSSAYKVNKDATAEDLVGKMPGVTIVDGKVQAQGEDVKQVLVDGKPFFGDDASAVLKNLPAEVIDKVQVFDKKSDQSLLTGFDDGNASKTINIVTKPQFRNGVFGKVYAGYGYDDKYTAGFTTNIFKGNRRISVLGQSNNINQQNFSSEDLVGVMSSGSGGGRGGRGGGRGGQGGPPSNGADNFQVNSQNGINTTSLLGLNYSDKWGKKTDVTGSYFFNWTQNNSISSLLQQYTLGSNTGLIYNENNTSKSNNFNNRINFKLETKLDSQNTITLQPRLSFQNNDGKKNLIGKNTKSDALLSTTNNNSASSQLGYNISMPLLYRHSFAKKGRTFSVNVTPTFTKNEGDNSLYTINNFYGDSLTGDTIDQRSDILKNGTSVNGNVSYTEPLNKSNFILVNYTGSYTDNYSSKRTYNRDLISDEYSISDTLLTNVFKNNYQSQSAGLGYRFQKEKFNFSVNGAYQWAELTKYQEVPTNYKLSKNFESVLPSAQLQYKFTPKKNLRVNYRTSNNAPSIDQLQDVINNSNSLQLSTGNPDLKQDFQQNINIRYSGVNTDKATSFFTLVSGNYSDNYIGNSTLIANQDTVVYNDIFLQKGSQIIRPVNLNGYYSLRSFVNYTFPITKLKTNLSVNVSGNYTNIPGLINTNINYAKTATGGLGLVLSSNISEKFDFTISSNSSYSNILNTLQTTFNTTYFNQNSRFKVTANPYKGLVLQTEFTNTYYSGLTSAYNQSISLWNAAIGYKFLKDKQAEIRLTVYDILNKNNSVSVTNTDSYIQNSQTNVLNRYFLVTFTYNFKKYFAKKEEPKTDGTENKG
jgi:outer membrane receptor protein involved in Fe transport